MIGIQVKNRGIKNRVMLLEWLFGFVQEKNWNPVQRGFTGWFFPLFFL
jgi:hypothetical protein